MAAKKPVPEFYGKIRKDGQHNQLALDSRYYYQRYLDTNYKDGDRVKITIRKNYRNRTTGRKDMGEEGNQNGYLYGVVLPMIAAKVGDAEDSVKNDLQLRCAKIGETKYGTPIVKPFSAMSTVEFNHHVIDLENPESVRSWARDFLELDIPDPDKNYKQRGYTVHVPDAGDNSGSLA